MTEWLPATQADLAALLHEAAEKGEAVRAEGGGSKRQWGGPPAKATVLKTSALNRVLEYEPRDLTICLEAGVRYRDLTALLAQNRQMLPLDPPYAAEATIGGIVATGVSGPRRRLYGGIRDLVIGMNFATLDGNIVETGGKVVKNVAGFDMQKAMIGSYGTLAVITQVNFKLAPLPESTRTFLLPAGSLAELAELRNRVFSGVLQPAAFDALNGLAAERMGMEAAACLLIRASGNERVLSRYAQDLPGALTIEGTKETDLWQRVEAFAEAPRIVAQVGYPNHALGDVLSSAPAAAIARAANGVAYLALESREQAAEWIASTAGRSWSRVIVKAPPEDALSLDLWPEPGPDFDLMQRLKSIFDSGNLLNKGRLYGRI